ncbi:hypothetical protein AB0I60_34635 [Actinosynnema sp. NPDC050436]|uniref:hypothetical protein n=1 Tax=Actinosynnema sp. NPDC050436 TaxID=3155659 RepID=UPI0033FCC712
MDSDSSFITDLARPQTWRAVAPVGLPRLRREILAGLTSETMVGWATAFDGGLFARNDFWRRDSRHRTVQDRARRARAVLEAEAETLRGARLCAVDADMSALARDFGRTPAHQPLDRAVLPGEAGFVVFDEPIGALRTSLGTVLGYDLNLAPPDWVDTTVDVPIPVVAATWARRTTAEGDHLDVSFYRPRMPNRWQALDRDLVVGTRRPDGLPVTAGTMAGLHDRVVREAGQADVSWCAHRRLRFGHTLPVPTSGTCAEAWLQVLYALFQLHALTGTQTPISETDHVHVPAAERRRDRRADVLDPSGAVHVVRLHSRHRSRPTDPTAPGQARGPLDFRYPVGLYRQPSRCMDTRKHKEGTCYHVEDFPVGFHLRGPADAPIRHRVDWIGWRVRHPRPPRRSRRTTDDTDPTAGDETSN